MTVRDVPTERAVRRVCTTYQEVGGRGEMGYEWGMDVSSATSVKDPVIAT